ncbi:MAG TPA: patatin-like phospholipase family protein [Candidatus Elarobacter sp.]|nr:patatin-like phospholipase family protein [Candidatus Elarobacter sp.]
MPRALGTWPVVYVGVGFWTLGLTLLLIALPRRHRLPSFWAALLGWVVVWSGCNDNHDVRVLPPPQSSKAARTDDAVRAAFDAHVAAWLHDHRHCPQLPCRMEIVAAEGGGLRAAYWTAIVLDTIDRDTMAKNGRPFSDSVFAVSGVSGGAIGATVYYTARAESPVLSPSTSAAVHHIVSDDYLSPLIAGFVFGNALQWITPAPIRTLDRAWNFEDAWAASWRKYMHSDRFSLRFPQTAPTAPELFLNATNVESGRRFVISDLLPPREDRTNAYYAYDASEPFRIGGFTTKTALHLSSRFSYASPAGTLYQDRNGKRVLWGRLVDGGYFDNTGLTTAFEVVEAVRRSVARCHDCGGQPTISVRFISNNPGAVDALDDPEANGPPPERPSSADTVPRLSGVLAVPDAHFAAGAASGLESERYRGAHDVDGVFQTISLAQLARSATPQGSTYVCRPALGWWLSQASTDFMDRVAGYVVLKSTSNEPTQHADPTRATSRRSRDTTCVPHE